MPTGSCGGVDLCVVILPGRTVLVIPTVKGRTGKRFSSFSCSLRLSGEPVAAGGGRIERGYMQIKPFLLDLYCCAGGCTKGYQRAGFYVVGVDINSQPRYCGDAFVQMDAIQALETLLRGDCIVDTAGYKWFLSDFFAIHASPPCQAYSGLRNVTIARYGATPEHPDLIASTREALQATGKLYIIENVTQSPLNTQIILCGAAFGLKHIARHRHFESNVFLPNPPRCAHRGNEYTIGIYGERPDGRRVSPKGQKLVRCARSLNEASQELGIDWMDWNEITQAIPPAYTEWIGQRLMEAITC